MDNIYDVIVLGGGPAGVAGGIYASRKRLKSLFITKEFGGQAINSGAIENFIGHIKVSGLDFAKMLEEHLRAQDHIEIKDGTEAIKVNDLGDSIEVETSDGNKYQSKTLLYALGSRYRKLNIPGESELEGRGVFFCSICDAPLMKNKYVAVIGGGNSGAEAVFDLLPYAKKIYLLQHSDKLKMEEIYKEKIIKNDKVEIVLNAETINIFGSQMVEGLEYKDLKTNESKELDLSGIFVSIGFIPNSKLISDIVDVNERGSIIVDYKTFRTSNLKIWSAGDVANVMYKQINPAIGDGVNAMLNIHDYIRNQKG